MAVKKRTLKPKAKAWQAKKSTAKKAKRKPKPEPELEILSAPEEENTITAHTYGRGQPSKYRKEYAKPAAKMCELGATDADLADFFDVSVRTIWRWQAKHAEFCHALKIGKEIADDRVERSLYHCANGYEYDAEKVTQTGGVVTYRAYEPKNHVAAIFWLKNRRSKEWRDKHEVGLTADESITELWKFISQGGKLPKKAAA